MNYLHIIRYFIYILLAYLWKELIDQLYEVTEDLSTFPRWDMEMRGQIVDCVDTGIAKFLISKEGA